MITAQHQPTVEVERTGVVKYTVRVDNTFAGTLHHYEDGEWMAFDRKGTTVRSTQGAMYFTSRKAATAAVLHQFRRDEQNGD